MKSGRYDDGFQYDAYFINPDSTAYIVFEFTDKDTSSIWSVQVSGKESKINIGLKGLKFGDDSIGVKMVLGNPDERENIGKYGEQWILMEQIIPLK